MTTERKYVIVWYGRVVHIVRPRRASWPTRYKTLCGCYTDLRGGSDAMLYDERPDGPLCKRCERIAEREKAQ